jgi:NAD(P)-dependent dehydrogenase (short-subunit alcohol dehydrogenase family)
MAAVAALPGGKSADTSAYLAAKTGVIALMHAVALEERGTSVRSNATAPTAIRTRANLASIGADIPCVERETVASMIPFSCSPLAANISGQVIELA